MPASDASQTSNTCNNGKKSDSIPVKALRTTFFWPLTLDVPPASSMSSQRQKTTDVDMAGEIEKQIKRLDENFWKPIDDPLEHIPLHNNASHAHAYAEFTYFHDFIQSFLFKKPNKNSDKQENPVFHLFKREDVKNVTVTIEYKIDNNPIVKSLNFCVERLNLYVFEAGTAFLVLDLAYCPNKTSGDESQQITLNEVMMFNDRMRRSHAPFLTATEGCHLPAFTLTDVPLPSHVSWLDEGQKVKSTFDIKDDVRNLPLKLRKMVENARTVPPFRHWTWLLNGEAEKTCCTPEGRAGQTLPCKGWVIGSHKGEFTWRHVADDRLPILSTITLPNMTAYNSISEGDWMRLAYVDPPGDKKYPYAKAFVQKDWENYTYDRFHFDQYDNEENSNESSRYLISGYSLLAVGCGKADNSKQSFFEEHITIHMRRHYFQLMLLAQLEKTALLAYSSRISRAVSDFREERDEKNPLSAQAEDRLTERLSEIERDFLQFVHLFRFTGVSNQIQPTEMFTQIRKQMALKELFDDVKTELETANAFLDMRVQQRQAKVTEQLTKVATIGVIASLAFSFLGMNVLVKDDFLNGENLLSKSEELKRHLFAFSAVLTFFTGLGWVVLCFLGKGERGGVIKKFANKVMWASLLFLFLSLLAWASFMHDPISDPKSDCTTLCPSKSP